MKFNPPFPVIPYISVLSVRRNLHSSLNPLSKFDERNTRICIHLDTGYRRSENGAPGSSVAPAGSSSNNNSSSATSASTAGGTVADGDHLKEEVIKQHQQVETR